MARNAPSSTLRASGIWFTVLSSSMNSSSSQCLESPVLDPPELQEAVVIEFSIPEVKFQETPAPIPLLALCKDCIAVAFVSEMFVLYLFSLGDCAAQFMSV